MEPSDFYNLKTPKAYGKPRAKNQSPVFAFGDGDAPGKRRFFYLDKHWISWLWNDRDGWNELPPSSTILALQWLDHVSRQVFDAEFERQMKARSTTP